MKHIFIFLSFIVMSLAAIAVPAYPGLVNFSQPDGSKLNIYLRGDEKVHWAETEDGYSLLYDSQGYLCYAVRNTDGNMVASEMRATDVAQRPPQAIMQLANTPKKLRFSQHQVDEYLAVWNQIAPKDKSKPGSKALIGQRKALVVLFQTRDCTLSHMKMDFIDLFNQHNYTANYANGSVYDYYYEASNGLFELQVDVIGPITGDHTMAYYGSDDSTGSYSFGTEVAQKIEGLADFSEYDNDHDGVVDGMHIIFAGYGEEAGASSDRIWSHAWYVWNAPTYNGVTFGRYSCSPELAGNFGSRITAIGVICHELGHVFGAPDYYDTDYAGSGGEFYGLGNWDIMSGGSWNNNGRSPARHGAYTTTYIYHWTTATLLDEPQDVRIEQAGKRHDIYRINTSSNGDFFLLENRQKAGFDRNIPGHGLIVYHAHPDANGSSVSNASHPQQLYILSAQSSQQYPDGTPASYGSISGGGTTYPGNFHRDSLTDNSTPWLRPWSGQANNTPLFGISESAADSSIYFHFIEARPQNPDFLEAHYTSEFTATAHWDAMGTYPIMVLVSDSPDNFATPDNSLHTGDTLEGGNIVAYIGYQANRCQFTLDSAQTPMNLYFKIFCQIDSVTFLPGPTAMASPYEFFQPQPEELTAQYTSEFNIDVAWQPSEPCQMIVLMSSDNQFDTPYGDYSIGDVTDGGDIVFYYGDDTVAASHILPDGQTPDTMYFRFFCRRYFDDYSDGITAKAVPYEYFRPYARKLTANYTSAREISLEWSVSEPCRMLIVASDDRNFETPFGNYATGDMIGNGDIVAFYGENTFSTTFTLPRGTMPQTYYFRLYCRYYGDEYSVGKYAEAHPTMSIDAATGGEGFTLAPNPACGKVTVTMPSSSDAIVILTDMMGRTVMSQRMSGQSITLDTSALPRGSYIVAVVSDEGRSVKKLLLK